MRPGIPENATALAATLVALTLCLPGPAVALETGEPVPDVKVELIADTTSVAPGQKFHLAVVFEIPRGWHIYWKNPGDSGLETAVGVTAPKDFAVGNVLYPGPERLEMPGGVVNFGYEGSTALFVPVEAPAALPRGVTLEFVARASWLACKEICVPGEAETRLTLSVRDAGAEGATANAGRLEPYRKKLPRPLETAEGVRVSFEGPRERPTLGVEASRAEALELFPSRAAQTLLVDRSVERSKGADGSSMIRASYRFDRTGVASAAKSLEGVVLVKRNGEPLYFSLRVDWTQ